MGLVALVFAASCWWPDPARAQLPPCFAETGFCLREAAVGRFFERHGGQNVLGYPISREFRLWGERVQLFQRVAVRITPEGEATALGLLDEELLPLRRPDGATLPSFDPALLGRAPVLDGPDGAAQAEAFLRAEVPDVFEGQPVGFLDTYLAAGGVTADPLAAMALFGWPTSRPQRDAGNGDLISQRFERAVFEFRASSGLAQPLLLGDYVKTALTGDDLGPRLEPELSATPLVRQYKPAAADGLHRPWELPDSNLAAAFVPDFAAPPALLWPADFPNEGGWPTVDESEAVELGPTLDGYLVGVGPSGVPEQGVSGAASNLQALSDFLLSVDARLLDDGPGGYGLHLRQQGDERLTLVVDAERQLVAFYRRSSGQTAVLWDWTPVPALRSGTEPNRLTVRARGPRIAAWANGSFLFDLEVGGPPLGNLWLAAVAWEQPARAIFANLRVSAVE